MAPGSSTALAAAPDAAGATVPRMAPCPCGSGERYKHCCGSARRPAGEQERREALAAQLRGDLHSARSNYQAALLLRPDDDDVLHMLALCQQQLGCSAESLALYRRLLLRLPDAPSAVWQNLNLAVAAAASRVDDPQVEAQTQRYDAWRSACAIAPRQPGSISVVMPSFNHGRFVGRALASVLGQSRRPDQIIVIDDGSVDDSLQQIHAALDGCAIAHRVIARGNRGAAETLNEAIAMADGEWIAPLNSDDCYDPNRLAQLQAACLREGIDWGFGAVSVIDETGAALARSHAAARELLATHHSLHMADALSLAFLRNNPAISTGNLFFRKSLWQRVGGFASLRYNHDWRFCLDAARHAEPLWVPAARYHYRWHGGNTIADSNSAPRREVVDMFRQLLADRPPVAAAGNPFTPTPQHWGTLYWAMLAAGGHLQWLPRTTTLAMLGQLAVEPPA